MEKTDRIGQPWKDDEIQQLLKEIKDNLSISEIANIHKRTNGGIISRLKEISADFYHNNNLSVEKIQKYTRLSEDDIVNAIERRTWIMKKNEEKAEKRAEKIIHKENYNHNYSNTLDFTHMIGLLTEIRDGINELISLQKEKSKHVIIKKSSIS